MKSATLCASLNFFAQIWFIRWFIQIITSSGELSPGEHPPFVEAWIVGSGGLWDSDGAVRGGSDAERCVVAEGDGGGGGADAENDAAVERWRFVDFARLPYSGRSSELIKLGEFGGVVSHVRGGIATLSAVVMEVVASCWEALDGTSTPSVFSD